jgi:hypothetical protein
VHVVVVDCGGCVWAVMVSAAVSEVDRCWRMVCEQCVYVHVYVHVACCWFRSSAAAQSCVNNVRNIACSKNNVRMALFFSLRQNPFLW